MIVFYLIWLFYLTIKQRLRFHMVFISLFFLIGSYLFLPEPSNSKNLTEIPEEVISLEGKITSQVYLKNSSLSFTLKQNENVKINVRYFYNKNITEVKNALKRIETGRSCLIKGLHSPPLEKSNPGQFDYKKYLKNQGIYSELIVEDLDDISCNKNSVFTPLWSLRNKMIMLIKENYSDFSSSWLIGLVLGEDDFIEPEVIELFRHWNIAHLLAISGLHTAIFVGIIYFLLMKMFKLTSESTQIILIFVLPIFTVLSGAEPSVIRASFMVICFVILNLFKIKLSPSDLLSAIFIILIFFTPSLLTHLGFQFSFAVTFSLLISLKWLNQTNNRLIQSFQISFISQMIILPLQLYYFTVFQPLSIILNVIVIPYFTLFVIPFMFLMLIGLLLPSLISGYVDTFFVWIHTVFLELLMKLDDLFQDYFIIGELNGYHFFIFYLILIIFMWSLEKRRLKQSVVLGSVFIIFFLYLNTKENYLPEGRVTMLDIGQGDAIIIEQPYREGVFMVDTGSHFSFTDMKPSKKVYNQVIKPYLYYRGIDTIDGVFLSHNHIDHTGSLQFMLKEFDIKEVFISPYHPIEGELLEVIKETDTIITVINPTEKIVRNNLLFQVLHPIKDQHDENDNSLIVYSEIGGKSWLFNGDASTHNELDLIKAFPELKTDILKVGHHGSNTSTDEKFLQKVKPEYALVSAGKNNVYGHPTPDVIERLHKHDIKVFRTDEDGAIEYKYNIQTKKASFNKYIK